MRVAIVSDIHGNRHAFEAVLDAIEASECEEMWCLGDLVGYGADPDACVELGPRARRGLPGRQPRSRRPRRPAARGVLARRRARRAVDAETIGDRDARSSWRARAGQHRRGGRPVPRQPARSGLGVRALAASGRAVPRRPGAPRLPDRPLARRALVLREASGAPATGQTPGRRRGARPPERRVADQPGQRRPAARRRPARGLARARPRRLAGRLTARTYYDIAGAAAAIRAARLPDSLAERLSFGQ